MKIAELESSLFFWGRGKRLIMISIIIVIAGWMSIVPCDSTNELNLRVLGFRFRVGQTACGGLLKRRQPSVASRYPSP